MKQRMDYMTASPGAFQAMLKLETFTRNCGLEAPLRELVKLRASIINGCAFCVDMHWKDARAAGETEQRLYGVATLQEVPYFTERERAALAWTEAVTLVAQTHVPDEVYEEAKAHFTDQELVNLSLAVAQINVWNRLAIAFRAVPGTYQPNVQQLKKSA